MEHITERYGEECNLFQLTLDEYKELEPFLRKLGVRTRATMYGDGVLTIQGENPYKKWLGLNSGDKVDIIRKRADEDMSDFRISCYKR